MAYKTLRATVVALVLLVIASSASIAESRGPLDARILQIQLLNPEPSTAVLRGAVAVEVDGSLQYRFVNAAKNEQLVLLQHPGAARFEVAEARVTRLASTDGALPIFPGAPSQFSSGLGVRLGLSRTEVTRLLGDPARETEQELEYHLTAERDAQALAPFNMPEYRAVYRFDAGRLVAFEFGFPYP